MNMRMRSSTPKSHPKDASPLDKMVSYRLSRAQAKLNAQANRILKKHGDLSLMQWRVLVILDVIGPSTHADIARLTEIDKGQLSRTIKGMIADGLLTSVKHKDDSRQFSLRISGLGRDRFELARPAMRARQRSLHNCMSEADLDILFKTLSKLEAIAEGN